ncbi:MAG: hypothetical protein AB7E72_03440 [Lysobacterales bacterium]
MTRPIENTAVSVVFFGNANAGKSTLVGYLLDQLNPDISARRIEEELRRRLGRVREDAYYSNVVDRRDDEVVRGTEHSSLGTSKEHHVERIARFLETDDSVVDAVLIDTPGAAPAYRQRIQGMSYGDVGVFVLELPRLIRMAEKGAELRDHIHFFAPLKFWLSLRPDRLPVIVLSKGDLADPFLGAKMSAYWEEILVKELGPDHPALPAIITEVRVGERASKNVLSRDAVDGVQGLDRSLLATLRLRMVESLNRRREEISRERLLLAVSTGKESPGKQTLVAGKVLRGEIAVGQTVRLLPVRIGSLLAPRGQTQRIATLQREGGEQVMAAARGEHIRFALKVGSREVQMIRGALVLGALDYFEVGSCFAANFDDSDWPRGRPAPGTEQWLFWFGKVIWIELVVIDGSQYIFQTRSRDPIVMSQNADRIYDFDTALVGADREMSRVLKGKLVRIGELESVAGHRKADDKSWCDLYRALGRNWAQSSPAVTWAS